MAVSKLISSDTHVVEPPDLWTTRMGSKYRDDAPRVMQADGADWWIVDGRRGTSFSSTQVGLRFEHPEELRSGGHLFERVRPGGFIPKDHIADMDADGVAASVLYPTTGLVLFTLEDDDVLSEACRAYNDWMAEFCSEYPTRTIGVAMLNVNRIEDAVSEARRAKELGLRGVIIPALMAPEGRYYHDRYDPLWAALEELKMPVGLHTGGLGRGMEFRRSPSGAFPQTARTNTEVSVRESLADIIFSGVFDRHPGLIVGAVEYELGWVPYFLQRMDYTYTQREDNASWYRLEGGALPSDAFREHCFCSFQDDGCGIRERHFIGVHLITWGSDYPHAESTWPRSLEITGRRLQGVSPEEQIQITSGNVARIYAGAFS